MIVSLYLASLDFEPVYGWLEEHPALAVEVWGLDGGRRMVLLAYSDGPGDDYGWANWARAAFQDPSQLSAQFETLELVGESEALAPLQAAFPTLLRSSLE